MHPYGSKRQNNVIISIKGSSLTTNPKPRRNHNIPVLSQVHQLLHQNIEPLRCLALRTRGSMHMYVNPQPQKLYKDTSIF